jgi:shikimate kinase
MIHLIGPGGAGKSTTGALLADTLGCSLYDLDRRFEIQHGDIDEYIRRHGYLAYAEANVETYRQIDIGTPGVFVVSSGFMTYPSDVHPQLPTARNVIIHHPSTVLLLPSLDLEACVAETVRRQQTRPLAQRRTAAREEEVIRQRFLVYSGLAVRTVTTMRSPPDVVAEILASLIDSDRDTAGLISRAL